MALEDWLPSTPGEPWPKPEPCSIEEAMRRAYERGKRPHVYDPYAVTAPMSPAEYERYRRDVDEPRKR